MPAPRSASVLEAVADGAPDTSRRAVAVQAARSAGQVLRDRISTIREVRHKGLVDIVTDVDLECEAVIRRILLGAYPTHTIVGEEGGTVAGSEPGFRWYVDPLDGTTNYAHGFPFFCVSIGLEVDGALALGVIYDPAHDELFVAEPGKGATLNGQPIGVSKVRVLQEALLATGFPYDRAQFGQALSGFQRVSWKSQAVRRAGSAALDLCYVACGRLDGYWEYAVRPWDVAAGALLVREAGGRISSVDGTPFGVDAGNVLSSNGYLHQSLTDVARPDAGGMA